MEGVKGWLFVGIMILSFLGCCHKNSQTSDSALFNENSEDTPIKIANPAALYCLNIMGYEFIFVTAADGAQSGVCIMPDGQECNSWSFYAGECGAKYSYCMQNDMKIETRSKGEDPYAITYGVCVDDNEKEVLLIYELLNFQ